MGTRGMRWIWDGGRKIIGIGGHLGSDVESSMHSVKMTLVRRILQLMEDMSQNQPSSLTRQLSVIGLGHQHSCKVCNVADLQDMLGQ